MKMDLATARNSVPEFKYKRPRYSKRLEEIH